MPVNDSVAEVLEGRSRWAVVQGELTPFPPLCSASAGQAKRGVGAARKSRTAFSTTLGVVGSVVSLASVVGGCSCEQCWRQPLGCCADSANDRPAASVNSRVFGAQHYGQIFQPVVSFDSVNVVDDFIGRERASEVSFHHGPMFALPEIIAPSLRRQDNVAVSVNGLSGLVVRVVRSRAFAFSHNVKVMQ